jgi:thiol:disulfide interchange protein
VRQLLVPAPQHGTSRPLTAAAQRTQRVAALVDGDDPWWQHGSDLPNERAVHSTQELLDALSRAGDALVVCHFYAQWCGACKALHPKVRAAGIAFRSARFGPGSG